MLPFRNLSDNESIDESPRGAFGGRPRSIHRDDYSDDEPGGDYPMSEGSDGGSSGHHGNHEDAERLLVLSTISRDTTNNAGAADSVNLSKLATHINDLPLNSRAHRSESLDRGRQAPPPPPRVYSPSRSPPPRRGYSPDSLAGYISSSESEPEPNIPQPIIIGPLASVYDRYDFPPRIHPTSILAKKMPGSDLDTLYRKALPDIARLGTYNWRDRLRIPIRRKSESDISTQQKTSKLSQTPQYSLENEARRELVQAWKLSENDFSLHRRRPALRRTGDMTDLELGAILGRTAESQIGLDLFDDSPQSMFYRRLMDAMEGLRSERNFLANLLTRPQETIRAQAPAPKPERKTSLVSRAVPQLKILHRVFCKSPQHSHDQVIFEDLPVRTFSKRSQDMKLSGKKIIRNLAHYSSQNPDICIIIFKEHLCVEDTSPRPHWRSYQRRAKSGSEISSRSERLCIVSETLQKALDHVALCPPPESRVSSRGMREMDAPYLFLYHHRALLLQYEKEVTGLVKENISLLLGFLQSNYDAEYRQADAEFAAGNLTDKHVEKLFRPNEIVVDKSGEHSVAYVVKSWPEIDDEEMKVSCWCWQYDGRYLNRQDTVLRISLPLSENFTIDQLPFCPLSAVGDQVVEDLRKRGRKFWSMKGQYFGCFSGPDSSGTTHHHHIRVVVDMATYSKMHSTKFMGQPPYASRFDPWPNRITREAEPDDSMVLLLPPTVFGFVLQEKSWVKLAVNGIHPIEWNKRAFDRLVLEPRTKELITALVEVRIATGRTEDIIEGKGNGLMILLHGSPGTGKTLTAESVAEIAEKPLYRVTCGDIGTYADDVEQYLQTVLYLGKTWNCVLLLDEADVFLEERSIADLQRNSLVSVFLRILEYYDGILIMTSNRVGTFDEAFKSRIQVSLHYEDLTKKSRRTIWNNFIVMLEEAGEDVSISDLESHLDEMAEEEINGRQIRNAMTTARQLALHRKERLHWEHLDQVLRTGREFNRYLKNVQGHTDKQWAREQRLR